MVAVKRIRIDERNRQSRRKAVQREEATLRARKHPHIVPLLASFIGTDKEQEMSLHLLFPYAEGGNLQDWMMSESVPENPPARTEDPSMTEEFIYESILTIVSALAYVHSDKDGMWTGHYDIKPANVLLFFEQTGIWVWKLSDFGHSYLKPIGTDPGTGRHIGSLDYQPPEYWESPTRGQVYLSFDVFAMGCIVIQLATLIAYPQWEHNQVKAFYDLRGDSKLGPNHSKDHPFGKNKSKVDKWIDKLKQASSDPKFRRLLDTAGAMLNDDPNQRLLAFDAALDIWALCNPEDSDKNLREFGVQCKRLTEGQGRSRKFGDCYNPVVREKDFAAIHGPKRAKIRTEYLAARSWHRPPTNRLDDVCVETGRISRSLTTMPATYRETTLHGRNHQLHLIERHFENTRVVCLVGLGGIGKSHLAWRYASDLSKRKSDSGNTMHVFWLQAQNQSVLETSYIAVGKKLGIINANEQAYLVAINNWLKNEEHGPWLMVFDGVDESCADLSKYCPWNLANVLITTKDRNVALRYCKSDYVIELSALDAEEGVKILKDRVENFSVTDEEPAKALVSTLHFPLYIELMGAYICENAGIDVSIKDMHRRFRKKRTLAEHTAQEHTRQPGFQDFIAEEKFTFFDIVFEPLKKRYKEYRGAFRLMCLFSRNDIDMNLLRGSFVARSENQIIVRLSNFYFIKRAAKDRYSVHPLVQTMFLAWVARKQGPDNLWSGRVRALNILWAKYNSDKKLDSAVTPLHLLKLRSRTHVEDFLQFLKEYPEIRGHLMLTSARAIVTFARMFRNENRFKDAVLLLDQVINQEIRVNPRKPIPIEDFKREAQQVKLEGWLALIETRRASASGRTGFHEIDRALQDAEYAIQEATAADNKYMKRRLSATRFEVYLESFKYEEAKPDSLKYAKAKEMLAEIEKVSNVEPAEADKQQLRYLGNKASLDRSEGEAKCEVEYLEESRRLWQEHLDMIPKTTYSQQEKEEKRVQTKFEYVNVCLTILLVLTGNTFETESNEQGVAEIASKACDHAWKLANELVDRTEEKYGQEAPKFSEHKHVLDAKVLRVAVMLRIGRWKRDTAQIEVCVGRFQVLLHAYRETLGLPKSDKDVRNCAYHLRESLRCLTQHERYGVDYPSLAKDLERHYDLVPWLD